MTDILLANDVFSRHGLTYRLLRVCNEAGREVLDVIRMDDPRGKALPQRMTLETERPQDSADRIRILDMPVAGRPLNPTPSDVAVRDLRWSRIEGVVDHPDLWDASTRGPLLKTHAAAIGVSAKSLLADLRRYWLGGQTLDALLGNLYRSGRVSDSATGALSIEKESPAGSSTVVFAPTGQVARGRTPKDGAYQKCSLPAPLRKKVLETAKKHYMADESRTMRGAAIAAVCEHFGLRDEQGNLRYVEVGTGEDKKMVPLLKPLGQRPTYRQIQYMLTKALDAAQKHTKRHSKADFDNNHAAATGSVLDDVEGPGDVYEIDATWSDMWIVSKANRTKIIGKATFYLIIDRETRLIVGFYCSLENASWEEAKVAILSIAGDWEALHKRLGVPYCAENWPARGVMPNRFFGDRGEMLAYASEALCDGVRVQVCNAPALFARRKPLVEGGIQTVHLPLKESAAGFEPASNVSKRRGKKYHQDASFTLDEVAAMFLRIIAVHNTTAKPGYPLSPQDMMSGFVPTPVALWHRGIKRRSGALARFPLAVLRRKLLRKGVGQVRVDGVHFEDCVYDFPDARKQAWCSKASLDGTFDVEVAYGPDLVNNIYVLDPGDGSEHQAELTTDSERFRDYSFAEVKAIMVEYRRMLRAGADDKFVQDVGLHDAFTTNGKKAKAEIDVAMAGRTKASRFHGAGDARAAEAQARRVATHDLNNDGSPYLPTAGDATDAAAPAGESDGPTPATAADVPQCAADAVDGAFETDPDLMNNLLDLINQP